jgi:hypothetical protein
MDDSYDLFPSVTLVSPPVLWTKSDIYSVQCEDKNARKNGMASGNKPNKLQPAQIRLSHSLSVPIPYYSLFFATSTSMIRSISVRIPMPFGHSKTKTVRDVSPSSVGGEDIQICNDGR